MKGLSIKQRVTLFYAAILISMTALVCAFLLFTADFQSQSMTNTALEKAVKDATEGISYFDDRIEIDPDFDFYINGVAILLYGPKGTPLAGTRRQVSPRRRRFYPTSCRQPRAPRKHSACTTSICATRMQPVCGSAAYMRSAPDARS